MQSSCKAAITSRNNNSNKQYSGANEIQILQRTKKKETEKYQQHPCFPQNTPLHTQNTPIPTPRPTIIYKKGLHQCPPPSAQKILIPLPFLPLGGLHQCPPPFTHTHSILLPPPPHPTVPPSLGSIQQQLDPAIISVPNSSSGPFFRWGVDLQGNRGINGVGNHVIANENQVNTCCTGLCVCVSKS